MEGEFAILWSRNSKEGCDAQIPKFRLGDSALPDLDDPVVLLGIDWIRTAARGPVPGFHSSSPGGTCENSKLLVALWDLAATGQAAAKATGTAAEDVAVVILVPYAGMGSASIDSSSFAGLGVKMLARSKSLMRVSVPASSLLAVSELPGVSFVRRQYGPHPQEETWSEGGWLINAYDNLSEGVFGQGVKVAVIDEGFKGADERLNAGELPKPLPYRDL